MPWPKEANLVVALVWIFNGLTWWLWFNSPWIGALFAMSSIAWFGEYLDARKAEKQHPVADPVKYLVIHADKDGKVKEAYLKDDPPP